MRRQRWWLPLLALVLTTNWKSTLSLPVPDEEIDSSTKLLGSSVVTSVSVVTGSSENGAPIGKIGASTAASRRVIPSKDMPGSPGGLLRPDRFQFYTFNKDGSVVTKQMTEKEIQGLIAAGGGHLPMEIHEPQSAGDVPIGGMKVADVVQNVQNVLKGELRKPPTVMTAVPTIPGHENTEWSSILPAILGGESETAPMSDLDIGDASIVADPTIVKTPASHTATTNTAAKQPTSAVDDEMKKKPTVISATSIHSEKPMIQVPVITVEQKLPPHQSEDDSMPVFQMLNTISADKVQSKNTTSTADDSPNTQPPKIHVAKPDKIGAKPTFVESPTVEQSTPVEEKLPEMVEITFNSGDVPPMAIKPTMKPESPIKNSETVSKLPEAEPAATVSVVSETHSTSMKVSGHDEIPLRETAKPVDHVHVISEQKPEKTTKIPMDEKLDSTTVGVEVTAEPVTTEKPGLFAQGVSFFGNLPETVSSIVADFINNNANAEESDTEVPTKATASDPIGTKIPDSTVAPTKDASTTQEPVYQMIPEITSDKEMPPHGASPSEASSIEHIIETLNDPTGSLSGTIAADHFMAHTPDEKKESIPGADAGGSPIEKTTNIPDAKKPMSSTPIVMESTVESSSVKPVEPLPTELADSLTSMISQISDTMPSVLPVNPEGNFDATEKKGGSGMNAEEASIPESTKTTEVPPVSKISGEGANRIGLPIQSEPEKPAVLGSKEPEIKDSTVTSADFTTEKSKEKESSSAIAITVKTESSKLDVSTTTKDDLPSPSDPVPEVSANKADLPVAEKLEIAKPEADALPASSDITTDKLSPEVAPVEAVKIEDSTKSASTERVTQEITTAKPATSIASSTTRILIETEAPTTVRAEIVQKEEKPTKMDSEDPIVRIDITEAKPAESKLTTNSQGSSTVTDDGTESPLVRIQLMANPVTLINNMIESATIDAKPPAVEPLVLPEAGSVPPNTIASGLIAGFPSTIAQSTANSDATPEVTSIPVESVKSEPEVQLVNDAPASSALADDSKSPQVENGMKTSETPVIAKETVTEVNRVTEAPMSKPVASAEKIDLKEPFIAENTEKGPALPAATIPLVSTEEPKKAETIADTATTLTVKIEASTSSPSTKETEKEKIPEVQESTTTIGAAVIDVAPENRIHLPVPSISGVPVLDDKLIEPSKIIETAINSGTPEAPILQPESTEIKTESPLPAKPDKTVLSTESTKSETPIVRVEAAPEKLAEDLPSRIQLTDLPIVQTTASPKKPIKDGGLHTFLTTENTESVTTMQSPVESTKNDSKTSANVSLQTTALSPSETTEAKLDELSKKTEKPEVAAESSTPSEKPPMPEQIEEIRIQVNDTAVLVTKRPVSETSGQKIVDPQLPENQEHPTTPKTAPTTEIPADKLGENVEQPPKPMNLSDSVSNVTSTNSAIKPVETETRIRLGDEQSIKKVTSPPKLDDPRKPIKKNNDSPHSVDMKEALIVSASDDDKSGAHATDSMAETSTKMEIVTSFSNEKTSTPKTVLSTESAEKQQSNEKETPIRVTLKPTPKPQKSAHKPTMNIKKDDAMPKPTDEKWTLIPQQVYPALTKTGSHNKRPASSEEASTSNVEQNQQKIVSTERPPVPLDHSQTASGLDSTIRHLETDISYFANLCNELAFSFWTATNKGLSTARSLAVSPFGMTSMLAMVFLGARGPTSDQMNDILRLDDVASFNPHLVFQNVTDAVGLARNQGIANAAFVRELFADRSKVRKLMPFYKDQAQQFYDGIVAEVNFATISDLVRRRTNLMIRKQTGGRIKDFVRTNTVPLRSPLAALSANVFQTDCNSSAASSEGRDGELYFAVSPAVRQRKLVPVPATVWRAGVLAGYEPNIDATAIALGGVDKLVSTIFVMPGQQGHTAPGDTLERLEQRVVKGAAHEGAWNKLLKVLIPRPGLELQVPKFSHRSVINATAALKRMGLEELFSKHADLKGINGVATDLHLADVLQMNLFSTCGDENIISGRHHVEVYPGSPLRNAREYHESEDKTDYSADDSVNEQEGFSGSATPYESAPHREARSPRQTEGTERPRLKLDRPFLYFVRHNPTGLILHMGRFNPRLLP